MTICENLVTSYVSANFSETETAYNASTVYAYGAEARDGHFIYKSRVDSNVGHQPSTSELYWKKVRPSNYYGMLDGVTLTQTENDDTIDITITTSGYDVISLLNLDAYSVRAIVTDLNTSTVVYDKTKDLTDLSRINDFYSYCFEPVSYIDSYFLRIPLYYNATTRLIIDKTGDTAKCGNLVAGRSINIGNAQWGASFDLESWGTSTVDEFGYTDLEHTNSVYDDSYTIKVESARLIWLKRQMKKYDFIPLVFIGDEKDDSKYENLIDYGYWETIKLVLDGPVYSTINLTKKGLV